MTRERWEEGFDEWTPPRSEPAAADAAADVERESLLRLARELAQKRQAEHGAGRSELEQLKQELRERAEAIAARERELAELQRRLDKGRPQRPRKQDEISLESVVARERAALERAHALEARERELRARHAELAAQAEQLSERERKVAAALEAAQATRGESEAERQLAAAERERLEERALEARRIEKELAAQRIELETRLRLLQKGVAGGAPAGEAMLPDDERARELLRLEAKLEARERDLALARQGLDAERNALLERERSLRRRELADVRQSAEPPFTPPSFSEGLAAFVRERERYS
jgi:filamentous hemagglutinin